MSETTDVAVVGGGLSGLWAATKLSAMGHRVAVLEARDRVGGRTHSQDFGAARFDLGAQWVGPTQDRLLSLVKELGLETFPTHIEGRKKLDLDGDVSTYANTIPKLSIFKLIELQRALSKIERLAKRVPPHAPHEAPDAEEWDAETVESWKRRYTKRADVRKLVDVAVRTVFGADPNEISLLFFMAYLNAAGGFTKIIEAKDGAQQDRFVTGSQTVSLRLAEALGDAVHLSSPARRITRDDHGVTITTDGGEHRARYAVIAMPPSLAHRIAFEPDLPLRRAQLLQRYPMGATVKVFCGYDRAFWREAGFSGEALSDGQPISVVYDNTSHDGAQPALVSFIVGRPAREWGARDEGERRELVLSTLRRLFGDAAGQPTHYLEKDWSADPWTRGCPTGFAPPGVLTDLGRDLRHPVGRIHWAGTETATEWTGYMEGAMQAAERAAAEIDERLRRG